MLSILHIFPHLNLTIALWGRYDDHPHFADEEIDDQIHKQTWESPTDTKWRLQDAVKVGLKPCWFEPKVWICNHSTLGALRDLQWNEAIWKGWRWGSIYNFCWLSRWHGFPCGSAGKESTHNAGDLGSISGLGRFPGEGTGCPLQYSGLENSMDYSPWGRKQWEWLSLSRWHDGASVHWEKALVETQEDSRQDLVRVLLLINWNAENKII